jgi:hypothetical protein
MLGISCYFSLRRSQIVCACVKAKDIVSGNGRKIEWKIEETFIRHA